ncbi:cell wall-active antibiotics response protein LiaF [Eremococcus coleocola]|uniref:Cell wall-active antibiotics response LiaF-like C-terminal domain-containing protein n=1 Tax=Eremococcus coleocola ACS-139-V-Col8 TaxID=908337 RepID=E4KP09_9LACT|nr:cell wall-active antibiotics response protein LiaF [Eremococcus coleocola]EFR30980.1 hypothetical protein HMPREF9257_1292 [Eremococcus coleocola ACS-139-V-Col8]
MKSLLKRNIFIVLLFSILLIFLEILMNGHFLIVFALGAILLVASLFFEARIPRIILTLMSLFLMLSALLATKSFWLAAAMLIIVYLLFSTDEGNSLLHFDQAYLRPLNRSTYYRGLQLRAPQHGQVHLLRKQNIKDSLSNHQTIFEWDDINLVYIGGNDIIDLGNAVMPQGENVVMIRKLFGNTRIIIPKDLGIHLNISIMSGKVVFEQEKYQLLMENFRWLTPDYEKNQRRIKLIISVAFGDIEVIFL